MNTLISSNVNIAYSILIHDISMSKLLEFYYYQKNEFCDDYVAIQYYGKSSVKKKKKYKQKQDMIIFDVNLFFTFIDKLSQLLFIKNYPETAYINQSGSSNDVIIILKKLSDNDYIIAKATNIYDAFSKEYIWSINISNNQAYKLLESLNKIKNNILEKS